MNSTNPTASLAQQRMAAGRRCPGMGNEERRSIVKSEEMFERKVKQITSTHTQRINDIDAGKLDHLGGKHFILHLREQSKEIIANPKNFFTPADREDLIEWGVEI